MDIEEKIISLNEVFIDDEEFEECDNYSHWLDDIRYVQDFLQVPLCSESSFDM